jgi:hypothetical protein
MYPHRESSPGLPVLTCYIKDLNYHNSKSTRNPINISKEQFSQTVYFRSPQDFWEPVSSVTANSEFTNFRFQTSRTDDALVTITLLQLEEIIRTNYQHWMKARREEISFRMKKQLRLRTPHWTHMRLTCSLHSALECVSQRVLSWSTSANACLPSYQLDNSRIVLPAGLISLIGLALAERYLSLIGLQNCESTDSDGRISFVAKLRKIGAKN